MFTFRLAPTPSARTSRSNNEGGRSGRLRGRARMRRIVSATHIVTVGLPGSVESDSENHASELKVLLDTPQALLPELLVDIYNQRDSFTLRALCRVEKWPGWKQGGRILIRDEALRWASDSRDLSSCMTGLTDARSGKFTRQSSIGRDEASAFAANTASHNQGPNSLHHARDAVRMWPENIQYRLHLVRLLLQVKEAGAEPGSSAIHAPESCLDEGFEHCKTIISSARRALRAFRRSLCDAGSKNRENQKYEGPADAIVNDTDRGNDEKALLVSFIAEAYGLMGDIQKEKGGTKLPHAISAYTLALKHDPTKKVLRNSLAWCMDEVARASRGNENHGAPDAGAPIKDIESVLANHSVLKRSDSLNFGCTMCGECCRHADYIFLSPMDIWRLTRAPTVASKVSGLKKSIRESFSQADASYGSAGSKGNRILWHNLLPKLNALLGGALQWSLKGDLPLCYLSPRRATTGRCHFSFPIFEQGGRMVEPQRALALEKQKKLGEHSDRPDDADESRARYDEEDRDNSRDNYIPVRPEEWDFTEEDMAAWEEEQKMRGSESEASEDGDDEGDEDDEWEEEEHEDDREDDGDMDVQDSIRGLRQASETPSEVFNSFGRQALGCSLGQGHMPTMCSSYPIARELTIADFWHCDNPHLHSANSEHNNYVLVNNKSCEGLFSSELKRRVGGVTRVPAYPLEHKEAGASASTAEAKDVKEAWIGEQEKSKVASPLQSAAESKVIGATPSANTSDNRTIDSFLHDNNLDTRWKQQDWFMVLLSEISNSPVVTWLNSNPSRNHLLKIFRAALAACWYGLHIDIDDENTVRLAVYETTRKIVKLSSEFVSTLDHGETQSGTSSSNREKEGGAGSPLDMKMPMAKKRFSRLMATAMIS